jgi:hypothetical protein
MMRILLLLAAGALAHATGSRESFVFVCYAQILTFFDKNTVYRRSIYNHNGSAPSLGTLISLRHSCKANKHVFVFASTKFSAVLVAPLTLYRYLYILNTQKPWFAGGSHCSAASTAIRPQASCHSEFLLRSCGNSLGLRLRGGEDEGDGENQAAEKVEEKRGYDLDSWKRLYSNTEDTNTILDQFWKDFDQEVGALDFAIPRTSRKLLQSVILAVYATMDSLMLPRKCLTEILQCPQKRRNEMIY